MLLYQDFNANSIIATVLGLSVEEGSNISQIILNPKAKSKSNLNSKQVKLSVDAKKDKIKSKSNVKSTIKSFLISLKDQEIGDEAPKLKITCEKPISDNSENELSDGELRRQTPVNTSTKSPDFPDIGKTEPKAELQRDDDDIMIYNYPGESGTESQGKEWMEEGVQKEPEEDVTPAVKTKKTAEEREEKNKTIKKRIIQKINRRKKTKEKTEETNKSRQTDIREFGKGCDVMKRQVEKCKIDYLMGKENGKP